MISIQPTFAHSHVVYHGLATSGAREGHHDNSYREMRQDC